MSVGMCVTLSARYFKRSRLKTTQLMLDHIFLEWLEALSN